MKYKRILTVVLVFALLITLSLSGCGQQKDTTQNSSSVEASAASVESTVADAAATGFGNEPLSFTWYMNYDWFTSEKWGDVRKSEQWIKENKKVDITFLDAGGAPEQKFATMIASNQYPDVICLDRGPDVEKLVQAGVLAPLDSYVDKYTNLKTWLGDGTINMLKSSDDKLYSFPNWAISAGKPNGNFGWLVQNKIYEEMGKPSLETYDDLYNYLKSVKQKYPNIIPLETTENFQAGKIIFAGFQENNLQSYMTLLAYPNNGKLESIFKNATFKEAALYTSKLFREGLVTKDGFTETTDQVKEKMKNGTVAVVATDNAIAYGRDTRGALKEKDANNDWNVIWPIHKQGLDKNKVTVGTYNSVGWNVNVITKSAKNPEAIYAFLDWMFGPEGQTIMRFGPPGLYWDPNNLTPEGYPVKMNDNYINATGDELKAINNLAAQNWVGNTTFFDGLSAYIQSTLPVEKQDWSKNNQMNITWKTSIDETQFSNLVPPTSSEEGIIYQTVKDIYKQAYAEMIFAKDDNQLASILQKADKDADSAGYDKVLQFMTTVWEKNKKLLGIN